MSRRLRGQTTLQNIIGKSTISKKSSTGQQSKSGSGRGLKTSSSAPSKKEHHKNSDTATERRQSDSGELPSGFVACPICQAAQKETDINAHIDICLVSREAAKLPNQATLQRFTESNNPNKRSRFDKSSKALPSALPSSSTGNEGSPQRKISKGVASSLDDPTAAPALQPAHSPFEKKSQDQSFPELEKPAIQAEELPNLAPNSGRGGDASTSGQATRPDGRVMLTKAVGRRYNSNGLVRLGQIGWLEREELNPKDRNAILAMCAPPGGVLGYLPRRVAQHLSEAVQQKQIGSEVVVTQLPIKSTSPVDIRLEVWPLQENKDEDCQKLLECIEKAKQAAEAHRSDALERSSSGTGQILRANFLLLLEAVLEQDRHLLDSNELGFIQTFRGLKEQPQMLYLRLFLRAGPWFKLNNLAFSECDDIHATAVELEEATLAENLENLDVECRKEAVKCMKILEIQTVLAALDLQPRKDSKSRPPNKAQLVQILEDALGNEEKSSEAFSAMLKMTGPCLRLTASSCAAIKKLQRLFFLNEGQGLSHFLVQDLGFLQYPSYKVQRTQPVFRDRQALLEYEEALQLAAVVDAALERETGEDTEAAEAALAPALAAIKAGTHKRDDLPSVDFLLRFSAAWVYTTMATIAVSIMEKKKRYADACDILRQLLGGKCCPARRGEWWSRLTLNLSAHLKRTEEALETAESALADEWVKHGDRLDLQRRLLRLSQPPRRWKTYSWAAAAKKEPREVRIEAQPLPNTLGLKSRFPCDNQEGHCSVEQLALDWYAQPDNGGWQGVHAEGGIWSTLFGLLMWEVLFMSVPDIFRTSFQTAPLDLHSPSFYPARKDSIQSQLQRIRKGEAPGMIRARWESSSGVMCAGVNWGRYDAAQLAEITECIGGPGLAGVCKLLAEDRSGWQGGMPDLLLWNLERKTAKMSEVKGPRDSLSMQQRAWLNALSESKISVEVFKVVEPGTMQKSSRGRRR